MKKSYILITMAIIAALSMVSCKNNNNNKKAQSQEPTREEVQEMKQALADTVLAEIDAIADKYLTATLNGIHFGDFELTENEKLIKPDYLLDPSVVSNLVTKTQKVNALAILSVESIIRRLYDMPLDDAKEVVAKLAMDINHPIDIDCYNGKTPRSERIKMEYEKCKEKGDVSYFWQFHYAIYCEMACLLAQDPHLFFSKITEEQYEFFHQRFLHLIKAMETLAQYDEEMATLNEFRNKTRLSSSREEWEKNNSTLESAKQFRIANKDKFIARRNALLQ